MIAHLADRTPGPRWARDVAVALIYLGIGLLMVQALPEVQIVWWSGGHSGQPVTTVSVLIMAVACLGAVVRRTVPVPGLLLATAAVLAGPLLVGFTDLATLLVFTDLLYCSVLFTSRRTSRAVAAVSGAVVLLAALATLVTDGGRPALISLLNMLLLVAIPVLWGTEVRRHRDLADAERDRAEQAARMAELDREAAVAAERARMARDLHDVVAGQLSAIALQSEAVLHHPDADPDLLRRVLGTVREGSVSALAEMRTMIGLLRSAYPAGTWEPGDEPRTAPARLDQLDPLLDAARDRGLHVDVADTRPAGADPAAAVELAAYRIVQEGLTNAAKHAPGSSVRLALGRERDALVVRLDNDLTGTPSAPPGTSGGTGLVGLRERARAVGGRFDAGPADGGWRVRASLPLVAGPPVGDITFP
ncbi:histidine kinase [Pseudonocardia sp. KRD291]|uniref:sensor histidine kinase n=1 Tax=Pseudonocardia sp. KRD291 TaxID=2792007 RepID=UPI001C49DE18|nr:histidine kinase [Pseudonocardia sp. KRD291]MBW0105066.1 two-component sensor histidine kinase [Pseudonocardia sp. KRD291]